MKNKWNKKKIFLHRFDLSDAIFTMFKTNISHGFDSCKSQKVIPAKYLKSSHSLNYKPLLRVQRKEGYAWTEIHVFYS